MKSIEYAFSAVFVWLFIPCILRGMGSMSAKEEWNVISV